MEWPAVNMNSVLSLATGALLPFLSLPHIFSFSILARVTTQKAGPSGGCIATLCGVTSCQIRSLDLKCFLLVVFRSTRWVSAVCSCSNCTVISALSSAPLSSKYRVVFAHQRLTDSSHLLKASCKMSLVSNYVSDVFIQFRVSMRSLALSLTARLTHSFPER